MTCKGCNFAEPRMAGGAEGGDITECTITEQIADPENCPIEKGYDAPKEEEDE